MTWLHKIKLYGFQKILLLILPGKLSKIKILNKIMLKRISKRYWSYRCSSTLLKRRCKPLLFSWLHLYVEPKRESWIPYTSATFYGRVKRRTAAQGHEIQDASSQVYTKTKKGSKIDCLEKHPDN
jgi:hypothetical protein